MEINFKENTTMDTELKFKVFYVNFTDGSLTDGGLTDGNSMITLIEL